MGALDLDGDGGCPLAGQYGGASAVSAACTTRQSTGNSGATTGECETRHGSTQDGRRYIAITEDHRAATERSRASLLAGRGLSLPAQARPGDRSLPGGAAVKARLRRSRGRTGF